MIVTVPPNLIKQGAGRRGTPIAQIQRVLKGLATFQPYHPRKRGDVFLGVDTVDPRFSHSRKVIFMGAYGKRPGNLKDAAHIVFTSEWYRKLYCSRHEIITKSSVIPYVGGVPADQDMSPVLGPRQLSEDLQFVIVGKWWKGANKKPSKKRKHQVKRLKELVELYRSYLLPKYPSSVLNVLGVLKPYRKGSIFFHRKSFHSPEFTKVFRQSHLHIILSCFDTGPASINEALHYRVPFICTNNCGYKEYMDRIDGKCGIVVKTDPDIITTADYNKHPPGALCELKIDYAPVVEAVDTVLNNYEDYTSWRFKKNFSYKIVAKQWMNILKGRT